jgi:tetratricopeptide (TPR) repeat protein
MHPRLPGKNLRLDEDDGNDTAVIDMQDSAASDRCGTSDGNNNNSRLVHTSRGTGLLCGEEGTFLLESGTCHMHRGEYDAAELCLQSALRRLIALKGTDAPTSRALMACWKGALFHGRRRRQHDSIHSPPSREAGCGTNGSGYCQSIYDEGVHLYSSPVLCCGSSSDSAALAVAVLINLAQIAIERKDYTSAELHLRCTLHIPPHAMKGSFLKVRVYHNLGYALYRTGRYGEALAFYRRALDVAQQADLAPFHVETAKQSIGLMLFYTTEPSTASSDEIVSLFQDSLDFYVTAFGSAAALSSSPLVATVCNNLGRVYFKDGKFDEARNCYEIALKIRRVALAADSVDLVASICNLGQVYHAQDLLDDALVHFQEFLDRSRSMPLIDPIDTAAIHRCVGDIYLAKCNYRMARGAYRDALSACSRCGGAASPADRMALLHKLGSVCSATGNDHAALKYYRRGLSLRTEQSRARPDALSCTETTAQAIATLQSVAGVHRRRGDPARALITLQKTCGLQMQLHGPDSVEVTATLCCMASLCFESHSYQVALRLYEKALENQIGLCPDGQESLDMSSTLSSIGFVLFRQRKFGKSKQCFAESLRIRESLQGRLSRDVAVIMYNLASVHCESGDDEFGIALHREALSIEQQVLGVDHPDVISTTLNLGAVYQGLGRVDEAYQCFAAALASERRNPMLRHGSIARLLNWMGNIELQRGNIRQMMTMSIEAARIYRNF